MWPIALGIMLTFSYNVLGVSIHNRWANLTFGTQLLALPTAVLNIMLLIGLFNITQNPDDGKAADQEVDIYPATRRAEVPPYIARHNPGS